MKREKYRTVTIYKLLSFQLTGDYVAVYANLTDEGEIELMPEPLEAIGLARLEEFLVEIGTRSWSPEKDTPAFVSNVMVGIHRSNETFEFEIANEHYNFSAVFKVGEDFSRAPIPEDVKQMKAEWRERNRAE